MRAIFDPYFYNDDNLYLYKKKDHYYYIHYLYKI